MDGRTIAVLRNHLEHYGQYTQLGELKLARGAHRITLRYGGPDLHPGSGGAQFAFGPLVLSRTTAALPVTYVRPANARALCGKSLDWVEAVASQRLWVSAGFRWRGARTSGAREAGLRTKARP